MSDDVLLYETLGVPHDASPCEIARAFYRKVNENTNDNMHELICSAYEILISPRLRRIYDREGLAGIDTYSSDTTSDDDRPPPSSGPVETFTLDVSLKKLYCGCTVPLTLETETPCHKCRGTGLRPSSDPCPTCQGSGAVYLFMTPTHAAPYQCPDCGGDGSLLSPCRYCSGTGTQHIESAIDVDIEPGTDDGDAISISSDILVLISQKPHPTFERRGSDLLVTHTVNLSQALCGFRFPLVHLDGRTLILDSGKSVISPGSLLSVTGEGFPVKGRPGERGDLFILFDVIFPTPAELTPSLTAALATLQSPTHDDDFIYC